MSEINNLNKVPRRAYRPQQRLCPICRSLLKRSHIVWRKRLICSTGLVDIVSWGYRCPNQTCLGQQHIYRSAEAEHLHLKHRRFSRELIIQVGYRRFWYYQTVTELYQWLSQEMRVPISERQVLNLIADFLALLRAAQPTKIQQRLKEQEQLLIGIDGMQPEKGNTCLYVVRELQTDLTLMAENLVESGNETLSNRLFEPLKELANDLDLTWHGVISDAQLSIRVAIAKSLPDVPHQVCQFHCLRTAGDWIFQTDRKLKKRLKSALRQRLTRLQKRLTALAQPNPYQAVLIDYADTLRVTLLINGIAPFTLGGVRVYEALSDMAASLIRCQKKAIIHYCNG